MRASAALICIACGRERHAPDCPLLDQRLDVVDGRYALEREIGRGAMGVIYLGRDLGLGRRVALKLMTGATQPTAAALASFQREAASLARVRSNHVVQVFAFGVHQKSPFFAMEYVEGEDLQHIVNVHLERGELLPRVRALTILRCVAEGLDRVHTAGLLHRDVKPANVVVETRTGRPVLVDFGLAIPAKQGEALTATGTPAYMAPEQASGRGDVLTPAMDQYSLACTAFEILTNDLPFDADSAQSMLRCHVEAAPRLPSVLRAELAPLDAVMARALAKDPSARFPTCSHFVEALADAVRAVDTSDGLSPIRPRKVESDPTVITIRNETEVLIVDDDPVFARVCTRAAQLAFFRGRVSVASVASGREAATRPSAPDLLLLDYDMPGMDGVQTLGQVRDLPRGHETRVMVVSAQIGDDERWRFGALGVTDFVEKPVPLPFLVARIQDIMATAGWRAGGDEDSRSQS